MKTSVNYKKKIQQETTGEYFRKNYNYEKALSRHNPGKQSAEIQAELENETGYKIEKVMFPNETTIIVTCGNQLIANELGRKELGIFGMLIRPSQSQEQTWTNILQCFTCYKVTKHNRDDRTEKDKQICSECVC